MKILIIGAIEGQGYSLTSLSYLDYGVIAQKGLEYYDTAGKNEDTDRIQGHI